MPSSPGPMSLTSASHIPATTNTAAQLINTKCMTGASAGIGTAFAQELAARKTDLVLVARSETKLQQLAQQLKNQYSVHAHVIVQDLNAPSAGASIFDAVNQKGLTIDLLINNAGFGQYGAFTELDGSQQLQMTKILHIFVDDLWRELGHRIAGALGGGAETIGRQAGPLVHLAMARGLPSMLA